MIGSVTDGALAAPAVAALLELIGPEPVPAVDRTGAARFTDLGVPAVTFGPGDPQLAHAAGEYVPPAQLAECEHVLRELLRA